MGTEDALHAIQTDVQVASRFDPLHLARWNESDAFRNFIVTFGKQLSLRKAASPQSNWANLNYVWSHDSDSVAAALLRGS